MLRRQRRSTQSTRISETLPTSRDRIKGSIRFDIICAAGNSGKHARVKSCLWPGEREQCVNCQSKCRSKNGRAAFALTKQRPPPANRGFLNTFYVYKRARACYNSYIHTNAAKRSALCACAAKRAGRGCKSGPRGTGESPRSSGGEGVPQWVPAFLNGNGKNHTAPAAADGCARYRA